MAPKEPCARYQYVLTSSGPKILPVQDNVSKEEESPAEYNAGGYLPVKVNDLFKDGRYLVLRKLGWGHFSTVWLVHDTHQSRYSALKVVKSASRYADTARDEIKLLTKVSNAHPAHPGRAHIVSFLDSFTHPGPETHICIVFEPLGENLLALIERNKKKGVPQPLVKLITSQILLGLQYLHDECDLVHTDIKPENILISIPDVEAHILAELSVSPSPRSRQVGVPHPTKSRLGMTIPNRRPPARERRVEIFDSQPLSNPSSRCGSISASASSPSLHSHLLPTVPPPLGPSPTTGLSKHPVSPDPKVPPINQPLLKSGSPSTASTASSSSIHAGINSPLSTPPTSVESVDIPALSKMASIAVFDLPPHTKEKYLPDSRNSITQPPASPHIQSHSSVDISHAPIGPSLLSRTAPPRTNSSSPSRSVTTTSTACPTPRPPSSSLGYTPLMIKIADLGNATPTKQHYTEDIQTRQYRAPEAILGRRDWGTRADMWSVACVVFELLTAEYLFDPHGQGEMFTKDDDHMAQIIELMGDFPLEAKMGGRYSREMFDHTGALRYIKTLKPWPLYCVMVEKYLLSNAAAVDLCAFLEPMLAVDQRERKEARDMIDHKWLHIKDEEWLSVGEW